MVTALLLADMLFLFPTIHLVIKFNRKCTEFVLICMLIFEDFVLWGYDKFPLIYNIFCTCDMDEHITFFMSHITILYMCRFITLKAYDIFESHMTILTENRLLPFCCIWHI